MLTRRHAIVVYDERGRALPDRLYRARDEPALRAAERALACYDEGLGQTRETLHGAVAAAFVELAPDVGERRVGAICALLDEVARFAADRRGRAARTRLRVFSLAARRHPLTGAADAESARAWLVRRLDPVGVRALPDLYPDVPGRQRLLSFGGYDGPEALLARYNVAQVQAALYSAIRLTIRASRDLRAILRPIKLARLLHEIWRGTADRYRIEVSGPVSVLRATRQYGARMARIVPALLACRGWRMSARLRRPGGGDAILRLSPRDGLSAGRPPPALYDSALEEVFARRFGRERAGWRLVREPAILHEDQHTFVPDFALRHRDGREILLEIVGFWTPDYLARKAATLRRFARPDLLVAVQERKAEALGELPVSALTFKTRLSPKRVLAAVEAMRGPGGAGSDPDGQTPIVGSADSR